MIEREAQKVRQDGYPIRMPGDFALLQQEDMTVHFITDRPENGNFTTLDMIHTKQELMRTRDTLATFLALKTSSELTLNIPAQNIRNHSITLKALPIHFLKSRYLNFKKSQNSHNPEFQKMLNALGLNPCQLVLSPTSSLSYALTKHFHVTVKFSFCRPSNRHTHAGTGKTTLATEGVNWLLPSKMAASPVAKQRKRPWLPPPISICFSPPPPTTPG